MPDLSPAAGIPAEFEGEASRLSPTPRLETLRIRAEFLAASRGRRAHGPGFTLQHDRASHQQGKPIRFGFTVTRKVGTATERNRIRRRLREALRQVLGLLSGQETGDFVVIGRREALQVEFWQLVSSLHQAISRLASGGGAPTRARS